MATCTQPVMQASVLHPHPANDVQVLQELHRAEDRGPTDPRSQAEQVLYGEVRGRPDQGFKHPPPARRHTVAPKLEPLNDQI